MRESMANYISKEVYSSLNSLIFLLYFLRVDGQRIECNAYKCKFFDSST